jgi:signal transduction histidine kinase
MALPLSSFEDPGAVGELSEAVSILLVDDEPRNLDVLESILGRSDYGLVRAQTADQALMALLGGEFAAIVLDIRMPEISGLELAQLIKERKRTRDIPILFLTAHLSEERDVLRGYDVGAVDYLTKPVNPDILRSKIAVFVDLFRKTRALAAANEALEKEIGERQKAEEALREANEELEARVQERTADLTRTNQALLENEERLQLAFEEKRQLLESERAARSEAERASRLKDEFLAIVSHELRTPLNAILGWAQILTQARNERPEVLAQGMDSILRNARAQAHLIEDLLDMSRIVSGKIRLNFQPVSLDEIVTSAVDTITPAAQAKSVQLDCATAEGDPWVHGDPDRLQQIVLNLLTNAVKFTPEGGQVRVSVKTDERWAEVVVSDTGQGIKPEFLPYVFDPFYQAEAPTTRRHGGLGLGLAVVSHLMELHGGKVLAESAGSVCPAAGRMRWRTLWRRPARAFLPPRARPTWTACGSCSSRTSRIRVTPWPAISRTTAPPSSPSNPRPRRWSSSGARFSTCWSATSECRAWMDTTSSERSATTRSNPGTTCQPWP